MNFDVYNIYVYMYICIYICICTYIYIYIDRYIETYIDIDSDVDMHVDIDIEIDLDLGVRHDAADANDVGASVAVPPRSSTHTILYDTILILSYYILCAVCYMLYAIRRPDLPHARRLVGGL